MFLKRFKSVSWRLNWKIGDFRKADLSLHYTWFILHLKVYLPSLFAIAVTEFEGILA